MAQYDVEVIIATMNLAIVRLVLFWCAPYSYHVATFAVDVLHNVSPRSYRTVACDTLVGTFRSAY
jgi:hypothetical protein